MHVLLASSGMERRREREEEMNEGERGRMRLNLKIKRILGIIHIIFR